MKQLFGNLKNLSMGYTKQTWVEGDIITAEKLNRIETGLENAATAADSSNLSSRMVTAEGEIDALQLNTINGKLVTSNPTLVAADVNADAAGSASTAEANAKSYTDERVAQLLGPDTAPETLDTIYELATAVTENADVIDTLNEAIGNKASKDVATTSAAGLMSSTDKSKLDGVAANASAVTVSGSNGKMSSITVNGTTYTAGGSMEWATWVD